MKVASEIKSANQGRKKKVAKYVNVTKHSKLALAQPPPALYLYNSLHGTYNVAHIRDMTHT
jgi:hypothetical protein